MKCYYDLHIHSALSPCGDNDMTPNNIVNMSLLKGLDVIALSDHNTCGNVRAVQKVAGDNILVIPAMEIETQEEVHMLSLFPDISAAEEMEKIVKAHLPKVENKPAIFGNQYYMDENDEICGEEKYLLVSATTLDLYETVNYVKDLGGLAIPAHIDRSSYSIISNLGFIPPDISFPVIEISKKAPENFRNDYKNYNMLTNSDAHYLWDISEKTHFFEIDNKITKNIFETLCKIT